MSRNLPSNAYWSARAEQRMDTYLRDSEQTLRTVGGAFSRANDNLLGDIDRIFGNYAKRHDLTQEQARTYLEGAVGHAEYERLLAKLPGVTDPVARADLLARINAPSARYRMSRAEALQANIYAEMSQVAEVQLGAATAGFQRTISDAYGRTLWDIQRGTGLGWRVDAISPGAIQEILHNPWSGVRYDKRIWTNQRALADWMDKELVGGMMEGRSVARMSRDLAKRMKEGLTDRLDVGYREAERLVRTETCFMANQAELQAYKEAGITHYRFLATLDGKTSPECKAMDGKRIAVAKAQVGVDLPPLHPYCRSTTVADIGEEALAGMERRARDPLTGELTKVPGDMTYGEWHTTLVAKWEKSDILSNGIRAQEDTKVQVIAKIDTDMLSGRWGQVRANVVLTDERIAHIVERHSEDYAALAEHIPFAIQSPSFILEDSKHENTAMFIRRFENSSMNVLVRLALEKDQSDLESSVITVFRLGETTLRRLKKRNPIVYIAP